MTIYFRVDGGHETGLGHLVRCLSIAANVREQLPSERIQFLTAPDDASVEMIRAKRFDVTTSGGASEEDFVLSSVAGRDRDTILIDKLFDYSEEFVTRLRARARIAMLHNYCAGAHLCDAYVVPGAHADPDIVSSKRWSNGIVTLYHGLDYVALNGELATLRARPFSPDAKPRVVITTGGSDPRGVMLKALEWVDSYDERDVEVVALAGRLFEHGESLRKDRLWRRTIRIEPYSPQLLADADAAFCTFGNTVYELMYLGIPVVTVGISPKHVAGSRNLAERCGAVIDLGDVTAVDAPAFHSALSRALGLRPDRNDCRVDGAGARRIATIVSNLCAGISHAH